MASVNLKQLTEELLSPQSRTTWLWWSVISLVAIFNLWQLVKLLFCSVSHSYNLSLREKVYHQRAKVVVTCFVIGCAFRSIFPVVYFSRMCFFSFQNPLLNRALAFIAEVSLPFGTSAASKFFLRSLKEWRFSCKGEADRAMVECVKLGAKKSEVNWFHDFLFSSMEAFGDFSILLVLFANICCNLGTISRNNWWFVIEENCWAIWFLGLSFVILFITFHLHKAVSPADEDKLSSAAQYDLTILKRLLYLGFIICFAGFLLVSLNDLPELKALALNDCKQMFCPEMLDFNFMAGCQDATKCSILTRDWEMWKFSASWQTPYFIFSVWIVLAFASCPGTELFRTKIVS